MGRYCDRTQADTAALLITEESVGQTEYAPNQCGYWNVGNSELSGVSRAKWIIHFQSQTLDLDLFSENLSVKKTPNTKKSKC